MVPAHVEASWQLIERWLDQNAGSNAALPVSTGKR
jgi:hypothetical protein